MFRLSKDETTKKRMTHKKSVATAVALAAVFLLSIIAIAFLTGKSGNFGTDESSASQTFSRPGVTVNDISRAPERRNSSSSAVSAQTILLSPPAKDQIPYFPETSAPAGNSGSSASSGLAKSAQTTVSTVQSIKVPTSVTISVGTSEGINIRLMPENAAGKGVRWSSDHPEIASVDKTGMVTGNQAGSCKISVYSAQKNSVKADILIVVK